MNKSMTDTTNNNGAVTNMSTVVKISVDTTCPPYTHKVESLCFNVPTTVPSTNNGCLSVFIMKYGNPSTPSYHIEDSATLKYGRLLKLKLKFLSTFDDFRIVEFYGRNILVVLGDLYVGNYGQMWKAVYYLNENQTSVQCPYGFVTCENTVCAAVASCYLNDSKSPAQCPYGFITCKDKTCIVETSRCDGIIDCVDGDDELNCASICTHPHPMTMCTQCNIAEDCRCNSLYFQCTTGGCISASAICNGLKSCLDGSDELMCAPTLPVEHSCLTHKNTICDIYMEKISTLTKICVYSRPMQNHPLLQNCEEWECSSMHQCEAAYCVPVHYICDRICDCPKCDDEAICMVDNARNIMLSCPDMVKCKPGYPCVQSHHIQDGEAQCVHTHDDEVHYPHCPENCSCHGTSIYCASFANMSAPDLDKFTVVSAASNQLDSLVSLGNTLSNCQLKCPSIVYLDIANISGWDTSLFSAMAVNITKIHVLNISHNPIHILSVTLMKHFHNILQLYMQHCHIHKIEVGIFVDTFLHILDLSHNKLNIIDDRSFRQLHNLKSIVLQNNTIHTIDLKVFHEASQLISIDLRGNKILSVWLDPTRWTSNAQIQWLYSDEQILCCIIPTTESCYPPASVFQSCSSLLLTSYNKITLGVVGIAAFVLNVGVFGYIVWWKSRERNVKMRQIISSSVHALTDSLYGVHIVGLVFADISYGEDFGKYRGLWKTSLSCTLLESCLSFSIIMSSVLIIHMCIMLFISLVNISYKISDKQYKVSVLCLSVSCAILVSGRQFVMINAEQFKSNIFCIIFTDENMGTKSFINMVFEWTVLSLNTVIFLGCIAVLTTLTWFVSRQQQAMDGARSSKRKSNMKNKLYLYISLAVISRLPWHTTWLAVMVGSTIYPKVFILLVLGPLAVWPICHPFLHTFRVKWN